MLFFSYSEHSKSKNGRERLGRRRRKCKKIELTFLSAHRIMGTGPPALCWNLKALSKQLTTKIQSKTKNTRLVPGKTEELQQNCWAPAGRLLPAWHTPCGRTLILIHLILNSPSNPRCIAACHVSVNIWQFEPNDGWIWTCRINILGQWAEGKHRSVLWSWGSERQRSVWSRGLIRGTQHILRFLFLGEASEFTWLNNKYLSLGM